METLAAARDVSIILVAIESLIIGILLTVLVIQLVRLTKLLREELLPILACPGIRSGRFAYNHVRV
jgi:hypothetical protein